MNKTELENKVGELKAELFNLRFQLATGQLQNTTVIASTKRDIGPLHDHPSRAGTQGRPLRA